MSQQQESKASDILSGIGNVVKQGLNKILPRQHRLHLSCAFLLTYLRIEVYGVSGQTKTPEHVLLHSDNVHVVSNLKDVSHAVYQPTLQGIHDHINMRLNFLLLKSQLQRVQHIQNGLELVEAVGDGGHGITLNALYHLSHVGCKCFTLHQSRVHQLSILVGFKCSDDLIDSVDIEVSDVSFGDLD